MHLAAMAMTRVLQGRPEPHWGGGTIHFEVFGPVVSLVLPAHPAPGEQSIFSAESAPQFCTGSPMRPSNSCYQQGMLRSDPMRIAALLPLLLVIPTLVLAQESKVTAEGMSEEFAIAEALREVPKGASVIDTSCRTQDVGGSTRYWCTLTFTD